MKLSAVRHEFVQYIPEQLEEGVVYISIEFATAKHRCCCGCGLEVVTPLSPVFWKLTFNGEAISLHPSIGNWEFPCRSHYWITENQVRWSSRWSFKRIAGARESEKAAIADFFSPPNIERIAATSNGGKVKERKKKKLA